MMKETVSKTAKKASTPATDRVRKAAAPVTVLADEPAGAPQAGAKQKTTPASRPAAKAGSASTAASVKSASAKAAPGRAAKAKATPAPPAAAVGSEETAAGSPAPARAVQGADELADKMKPSVVSKVSEEVMTKTTKPNSAAQPEGRILTDEEIRAMSDDDYMNPAQLAFFKAKLQQLERDLLKNAGETTEHLRETVLVPDPADRATIEEEHALELRTRDRERKLLKKVQQSLAAIEAGEYGWCEETGEPIGIPRLIARPTATLSLEAQQRRELKQKLYGD